MSSQRGRIALFVGVLLLFASLPASAADGPPCARTVKANVSALDQPFLLNRLGAWMVEGMVYALDRDVAPSACQTAGNCQAGQPRWQLREGKRPRPIVLRANIGDCLSIHFMNRLTDVPAPHNEGVQTKTRSASIHVAGMQVVSTIRDDGTNAGANGPAGNGIIKPGDSITYLLRATEEGTFLLNSEGAPFGGLNLPNDGGQVTAGLFGAVNVEPAGAVWLRSQITHAEMLQALDKTKGNQGFSPQGQPFLDFSSPVLNMLDGNNEIVATDLTAVIAGPKSNGYLFPASGDPNTSPVPYEPQRQQPFREFTIEYHELNDAQQAFPIFDYQNAQLTSTLQAGGDEFAINYGTGGIAAEILANRAGLGPMNSCTDCRFEEFFLSSWTVGDPAMIVDYPANSPCSGDQPFASPTDFTNGNAPPAPCTSGVKDNAPPTVNPLRKATMAKYPDDPSNVYHSYINDRVVFRTLHSGTGVSHVHHLHAHQWFHSPNADGSTYLDSQLINPGSAYTMEIAHLGSGNLNKVVGDSIFHCHFYPHFAAGMWAHWRSHDVFEIGTALDQYGRPTGDWNRAQPDGEIAAGTPIPALVPMPALPMAPMPARVRVVPMKDPNNPAGPPVGYMAETNPTDLANGLNPGFPFFIPGVAGTRAPHPPMDFAVDGGKTLDGGLPRHMVMNAKVTEQHNFLNFEKDMTLLNAYQLPEDGTAVEKVAMKYHAQCNHPTFKPDGTAAQYRTNGLPPVSGAPYADPGLREESDQPTCTPITDFINYRAAVIERDIVFNKVGWHFPQARFLTLWGDVIPTMEGKRAPEPFFIRANSRTGVNYWHTNLVPDYYLLDDFQVRTPTDIIGQHIHLVKFDVTSSDGAANGFNYEDGTLSYAEVQHQIKEINNCGGLAKDITTIVQCNQGGANRTTLSVQNVPAGICPDPTTAQCQKWKGAQTTVQRWYADPLSSEADSVNGERTLRTVFTHDHFGPSTHQQTGLYAALVTEPTKSNWFINDAAKTPMRSRSDGGPTSWAAIIETPGAGPKNTYREFSLAIQDFALAYWYDSLSAPTPDVVRTERTRTGTITVHGGPSWADPTKAVEPPQIQGTQTPGPQLISAGPTPGTTTFNYRNEPLPFRVQPGALTGKATDLSYVFASNVPRNLASMNTQPAPNTVIGSSGFKYPPKLTDGVQPGDPYTPLLRAYEGDRVQFRVIVGAHMLPHDFTVHGVKWLFEPSFANSGFRSNQSMGISEHFEYLFEVPRASPTADTAHNWSDYLYTPDVANQKHGIVDGTWGLMRAYKTKQADLPTLSTNPNINPLPRPTAKSGYSCPPAAPMRAFTINATSPTTPIVFNNRGVDGGAKFPSTQIINPFPLLYTYISTTPPGGTATTVVSNTTEPLIIRANAGECVEVTLKNAMDTTLPVFTDPTAQTTPPFPTFQPTTLSTSPSAGITPHLMSYDVMASSGMNIGFNPAQTADPNGTKKYYWYAGQTQVSTNGTVTGTPIELGPVNLTPSDPMQQDLHGLVGGMIVEPKGTIACPDIFNPQAGNQPTYASVTVYDGGTCKSPGKLRYREFAMITQDDVFNLTWGNGACYCPAPGPNMNDQCQPCLGDVQTAIGSPFLQAAINYRTEPMSYRFNSTSFVDFTTLWQAFSDEFVLAEPQTPIFAAARNTPVRLHLLHPGGSGDQQIMALHGHVWQELPYKNNSTAIGNNPLSMWLGKRDNYGANTAYSVILEGNGGAGGLNGVVGDYVYRTTPANFLVNGLWGLFRVTKPGSDTVSLAVAQFSSGGLVVSGSSTVFLDQTTNPKNGQRASTVALSLKPRAGGASVPLATVPVQEGGLWNFGTPTVPVTGSPDAYDVIATSPLGGTASMPIVNVLLPATQGSGDAAASLGETIRFVNTPRADGAGQEKLPRAKPNEGLLAPRDPASTPQAPKNAPPPPNPPMPPAPAPQP